MTTPDQLLADSTWRRRHSVYTLWTLFCGLGFVSLLYTGVRSKRNKWIMWGAIYGAIVIGAIAIGGSLSPDDPDAATPPGANFAYTAWMIVWVVSAIHVFRVRKDWLRWKAAAAWQPQWYEAPVASHSAASADLSGIGMEDPVAEFLAGPAPSAMAASRRPPPPPVLPRSGATQNPPAYPTVQSPTGLPAAAPESLAREVTPGERVDLNSVSVDVLAALPGVGVATATRIVEERKRRGGFQSVDEAALAVGVQPHVRARLQNVAIVSGREEPQPRRTSGRIVDI